MVHFGEVGADFAELVDATRGIQEVLTLRESS